MRTGVFMQILFLLVVASTPALADGLLNRRLPAVEQGNQRFAEQHFDQALEQYEQAEKSIHQQPRIHFNQGAALFKLGRAAEAREAFMRASGSTDPELKKRNYYNIGNTFLQEKAFADAAAYYRRALEMDPSFDDARFNLELALTAMKQQQQQQQQDSNQQQDKQDQQDQQKQDQQKQDQQDQQKQDQQKQDQQKQDQQDQQKQDQQDQQKQDQQKQDQQDQQKQDQQKQDQQDQQKQDQQDQQQPRAGGEQQEPAPANQMNPQQIQDLLDAMRENEQPFQMYRFMLPEYKPSDRKKVEKDW